MARDGSGNYLLPGGNPVVTNTIISSGGWANPTMTDLAAALTQSLSRDGQTTPTANLTMGNFRLINLAAGTTRTDAVNAGQIQDGGLVTLGSVAGTDTITASSAPAITVYTAGQRFQFPAAGANLTNAVTLNINGLGAKNVLKPAVNGLVNLFPGDIATEYVSVIYDGTQFQLQMPAPGAVVGRNRLINGDFSVSQYNGGSAVTPTATGYVVDRWQIAASQPSKLTFQQIAAPAGFLGVAFAEKISVAAAYTAAAAEVFLFRQPIEGLNVRDLMWGTSNAKSVSLQLQVSASLTGTYSLYFANYALTRAYVATISVTAANTPQLFTITIPGDIAGTWAAIGQTGFLYVGIDLGSGTNSNAVAGSWGAGAPTRTSGSVSLVANAGASITLSGVQLETGAPTSFEVLGYAEVLQACLRYYAPSINDYWSGNTNSTSGYTALGELPVPMRATPTVVSSTNVVSGNFPATPGTPSFLNLFSFTEVRISNATGNGGGFQTSFVFSAEL